MSARAPIIAVCGGGEADDQTCRLAIAVGQELAQANCTTLTGGLGGVMEAACKGAKDNGGTTIGIVTGTDPTVANQYVDTVIVSGMSHGRNAIIVHTADGIIALPGAYGTLSEIALALALGKPVVSLKSWQPDPSVPTAEDATTAVKMVLQHIKRGQQ
jgi:uncharacterized protein (TIGR00725 family)